MEKLLFIVSAFTRGGPQALRFQKITEFLKLTMEIHVIELQHKTDSTTFENGIWLHKIEYSKLGKLLHADYTLPANSSYPGIKTSSIFKSKIKKNIRNQFFPDTFISEKGRLIKKVNQLIQLHDFSAVIASGFPFTTMVLSETVKNYNPALKFIYDIGDPFYKNSHNGFFREFRAKMFERKYLKYIDKLVVTNKVTLNHYLNNFGDLIRPNQVEIVQQGVPNELLKILDKQELAKENRQNIGPLHLVYAGQLYVKLREPFELYNAIKKWNEQSESLALKLDVYGSLSDMFTVPAQNITSIAFKGKVRNTDVLEAYLACDVIVFLDNAFGLQTPGKVFEVAALGKPVLFISDHNNSPAYEVICEYKHIYFCKNNYDSIINAIRVIDFNVDSSSILKIRELFSWKCRAEQYSKLINN